MTHAWTSPLRHCHIDERAEWRRSVYHQTRQASSNSSET
jgi:hypothetical protein